MLHHSESSRKPSTSGVVGDVTELIISLNGLCLPTHNSAVLVSVIICHVTLSSSLVLPPAPIQGTYKYPIYYHTMSNLSSPVLYTQLIVSTYLPLFVRFLIS